MNENSGAPDPEQGLYRKYDVTRLNDPAGKHKDCTYYILDLDHDPHSVAALLAYAKSCEAQYPTLAFDLRHTAAATARKLNVATMPTEELSPSVVGLLSWMQQLGDALTHAQTLVGTEYQMREALQHCQHTFGKALSVASGLAVKSRTIQSPETYIHQGDVNGRQQ